MKAVLFTVVLWFWLATNALAATIFMETPDATQGKEFWSAQTGTVTYDTTIPTKSGLASWRFGDAASTTTHSLRKSNITPENGQLSYYIRFNNLPASGTVRITRVSRYDGTDSIRFELQLSSTGVLTLQGGPQMGNTGSTITTGVWYQFSFAWTALTTTGNVRFYVNGVLDISATGGTFAEELTNESDIRIGWGVDGGNVANNRFLNLQHVWLSNDPALSHPGDIRVTAKLPSTVTTNGFDTTVGTGAVNERPIIQANGKRHNATTQASQNYTLQAASAGDVDISAGVTLVARTAWIRADTLAAATTAGIWDNGTVTNISTTTTPSLFAVTNDSASYPSNPAGIGMRSTGTSTDTRFYECGTLIAYLVPAPSAAANFFPRRVNRGGP